MPTQLDKTRQSIDTFGETYQYDVAYMHQMYDASPQGYRLFENVLPMAAYHHRLPHDAYYVARIETMRDEDCGPCLQLAIDMAQEAGVSADVLRAALDEDTPMEPPLEDVRLFTRAVVRRTPHDDAVAERVRERYDEEGVAELALCIASSRIFPTIKRALGRDKSCSLVRVKV